MPTVNASTPPRVTGLTSLAVLFLSPQPSDLVASYPERCARLLKIKVVSARYHQQGEQSWVETQIRYDCVVGQRLHRQRFRYTDMAPHDRFLVDAIERTLVEARASAMENAHRETA